MTVKFFISLFAFFILQSGAYADGGCTGHGGDPYAFEFYQTAKSFIDELKSWNPEVLAGFPQLNLKALDKAVEIATFQSSPERLYLYDPVKREVGAINDSSSFPPVIKISRPFWDEIANDPLKKYELSLHDYLGIVKGLMPSKGEWDVYTLSAEIMTQFIDSSITQKQKRHDSFLASITGIIKNAKKPERLVTRENSAHQLIANKVLSCVEHSVLKTNFLATPKRDVIRATFTHDSQGLDEVNVVSNFFGSVDRFVSEQNSISFSSLKGEEKEILYLRETQEGDLVGELTTDYRYDNQPTSQINTNRGVSSYLFCSSRGSKLLAVAETIGDDLKDGLKIFSTDENIAPYKALLEQKDFLKLSKKCELKHSSKSCIRVDKMLDAIYKTELTNGLERQKKIKTFFDELEQKNLESDKIYGISVDKLIYSYNTRLAALTDLHEIEMKKMDLSEYPEGYMPSVVLVKTGAFQLKEPAAEAARKQDLETKKTIRDLILGFGP